LVQENLDARFFNDTPAKAATKLLCFERSDFTMLTIVMNAAIMQRHVQPMWRARVACAAQNAIATDSGGHSSN
jgi:hypothetical protein